MARFFCFRSILRAATTTTITRYTIFKPAFWGHFVHKHKIKLSPCKRQLYAPIKSIYDNRQLGGLLNSHNPRAKNDAGQTIAV